MAEQSKQLIQSNNHQNTPHGSSSVTQSQSLDELHPDFDSLKETFLRPFFFYGSLMELRMLINVLSLTSELDFREAQVSGYKTMLWGPFLALVREAGEMAKGVFYNLKSADDEAKLQRYELSSYALVSCEMELEDGTKTSGSTFLWVGDRDELEEGEYDFKAWQAGSWGQDGAA